MTTNDFDRCEDAIAYIESTIGNQFGPDLTAKTVAQACVASFGILDYPPLPPGAYGLMIPRMHWVIRDDDLKLSDAFFKAVGAAAGAGFFIGSIPASAVVGVLAAVYSVFRAVRKKGISLTEEQCLVLTALHKQKSPVSVAQFSQVLGWTQDRAEAALDALTKLRCKDGSVVAVAARDAGGLWAAADV